MRRQRALLWQRGPTPNESSNGSFTSTVAENGLRAEGPLTHEQSHLRFPSLSYSECHRFGCSSTHTVAGAQGIRHTYWSGQLWGGYGCAGVVQFHPTAQIKVTNFHWRHLQRKTESRGCHKKQVGDSSNDYQRLGCQWHLLFLPGYVYCPRVSKAPED